MADQPGSQIDPTSTLLLTEEVVGMMDRHMRNAIELTLSGNPHLKQWLHVIDTMNINDAIGADVKTITNTYRAIRGALFTEQNRIIDTEVGRTLYQSLYYMEENPRGDQKFESTYDILRQFDSLTPEQKTELTQRCIDDLGKDLLSDPYEREKYTVRLEWLERTNELINQFNDECRNLEAVSRGR